MTMKINEEGWRQPDRPIVRAQNFRLGFVECRDDAGLTTYHPCLSVNDDYAIMFADFNEADQYIKSITMALAEARVRLSSDFDIPRD
jgi:hypothetical protein